MKTISDMAFEYAYIGTSDKRLLRIDRLLSKL
jgi:hypothetical protein